ncbi:WD40 repeat-like protein [Athelia psychrophila]|uniref:WD40 repeat-like protein n=1 Tax=Athelia psychrophila TaxID=1759441 RepID=A0A166MQ86_9AGAM|nr:WD40 repeat-like protein [Fibularhizoctonia sp. CBS 109695]
MHSASTPQSYPHSPPSGLQQKPLDADERDVHLPHDGLGVCEARLREDGEKVRECAARTNFVCGDRATGAVYTSRTRSSLFVRSVASFSDADKEEVAREAWRARGMRACSRAGAQDVWTRGDHLRDDAVCPKQVRGHVPLAAVLVAQLKLKHGLKQSKYDAQGIISVSIKASDNDQARQNLLRVAQEGLARRHIDHDATLPVPEALDNMAENVSNNEDFLNSLGTVINKIQLIAEVTLDAVDALAKVHPYADAAWKVLSSVYKAYEYQKDTDGAAVALFKQMEHLYSFVGDVESLPIKIKQLEHTLVRILEQTTECGIFFREYTDRGFVGRFLGQAVSNRSQTISNLSTTLTQLNNDLNSGVQLHTAFMSSHVSEGVDRLVKSDILRGLKVLDPTRMNAADRPMCLPGTKQDRQKETIEWLMTPSDQNVMWLYGAAGVGKSTLATTIAEYFRGLHRRGAYLFFDRNSPTESSPSRVIGTLVYQLAEHDEGVRSAVSAAIERDPQLATAPLVTQFKSLLCETLSTASTRIAGPIVIVIDALDECGDANSRQQLLDLLSSPDFAKLPAQFRFIVTSRPEHDIKGAFHTCEHVNAVDHSKASDKDLMIYITHEIKRICAKRHHTEDLPENWPGETEIWKLVQYADGFFIWAATAMKLLFAVEAPVKWLADFLLHQRDANPYCLYKAALLSVGEWEAGETTDTYRRILGIVTISQAPLTDVAIADLLGLGQDSISACQTALRRLGSTIQWSEGQSARILDKYFLDYLTDPSACSLEPWFIDVKEHQRALTLACLRIMIDGLHFNMGDLKTSYIANADMPNLSTRVEAVIPQSLSYSCRFWGHHLRQTVPGETSISGSILQFFEFQFLYWLEVLSLLGEMPLASRVLVSVMVHVKNPSNKVYAFAQDGFKFVGAFAPTMACSTPHIYLSCIPFAPQASLVKQQYTRALQNTLLIENGMVENWPALLPQVLEGHISGVYSVAFSPDGQRIASGSFDLTIRIWDALTGALVAGPFEAHTEDIRSVVFSPDSLCIASCSNDKTVRIWDVKTGTLIAGPFKGHTDHVCSVAFSPDGQRIASCSDDQTIRISDAKTGILITGPFKGHTDGVRSVVFSPDGLHIASGSNDMTIRIWGATTGALIVEPLKGHTHQVLSVVISPDGQRLASGSIDRTIRLWDAKTGALIAGPFEGHTSLVHSVAFSPDSQHIASGSYDQTIRIWDAKTGSLTAGPLKGHTSWVYSVAFSPDGQRVASGSADNTIRIWDPTTVPLVDENRPALQQVFEGHTSDVYSVVFSPDGQRIASGSFDLTIRIWDAMTGVLVAGSCEGHTERVRSVVFSPDSLCIVSCSDDSTVRIWDAKTGTLIAGPFKGHTDHVCSVAFSPDGQCIASCSDDQTIRISDAKTGTLITGPFKGHTDGVRSIVFSPDGLHIASGSNDMTIRIWDAKAGSLIAGPLKGHTHQVLSVAISPDGQRLASGSIDRTIRVWDAKTGTLTVGPLGGHTELVHSVAFSPDSQRIVSGSYDQTIRIWDATTGALIAGPLKGHTSWVYSVAFSPDGQHIVSGSNDKTVRIWDATTGSLTAGPFEGHTASVNTVSSSQQQHSDAHNGLGGHSQLKNGWMVNSSGGLLFHIPDAHRAGLWWRHDTAVTATKSTCLDLTRFVHGEDWVRCHI